jgi:hypothetical protein
MSDQVSAVMARVEAAALEYHKAEDGTGEGEYGCPGLSCPGVQRLANFWTPIVEAALRSVPLSAETEGLRDKIADAWWAGRQSVRQWSVESASGPQLIAACDDLINKLLAAPTVAQAPTRCPYCSFDPTSMNDYCAEHRPARREAPEGAAPAVSREASVPQVGELERVRLRLIALWGDPEDCEDCAVIESRPCRVHANWENGE